MGEGARQSHHIRTIALSAAHSTTLQRSSPVAISVSVLPLAERAHQASTRNIFPLAPRFPLYRLFPLSLSIEPRHLAVFDLGGCIVLYMSFVLVPHYFASYTKVYSDSGWSREQLRDNPFLNIGFDFS